MQNLNNVTKGNIRLVLSEHSEYIPNKKGAFIRVKHIKMIILN